MNVPPQQAMWNDSEAKRD